MAPAGHLPAASATASLRWKRTAVRAAEEKRASCHGQAGWVTQASCSSGAVLSHFHSIYLFLLHFTSSAGGPALCWCPAQQHPVNCGRAIGIFVVTSFFSSYNWIITAHLFTFFFFFFLHWWSKVEIQSSSNCAESLMIDFRNNSSFQTDKLKWTAVMKMITGVVQRINADKTQVFPDLTHCQTDRGPDTAFSLFPFPSLPHLLGMNLPYLIPQR